MPIGIKKVGQGLSIPVPEKLKDNGDVRSSSEYIPQGMSEADRKALREAGLEWAGTTGGVVARNLDWIPDLERLPKVQHAAQAAEHMNHFVTGDGKEFKLSGSDVAEIRTDVEKVAAFETRTLTAFLDLVYADFKSGARAQYLITNETASSPNYGTNWFGMSEDAGEKWYFALGSFWVSYGALASRMRAGMVRIAYRMYIYDRYNWDVGKGTSIPRSGLSMLLDEDVMKPATKLTGPAGYSYFDIDEKGGKYHVNDSLLGALVESGDADNFDVTGSGEIRYKYFPPKSSSSAPAAPATGGGANNSGGQRQ